MAIFFWQQTKYFIGSWGGFTVGLFIQALHDGGLIDPLGWRWALYMGTSRSSVFTSPFSRCRAPAPSIVLCTADATRASGPPRTCCKQCPRPRAPRASQKILLQPIMQCSKHPVVACDGRKVQEP